MQRRERRLLQLRRRELRHELLGGDVVVVPVVRPEELRVVIELRSRCRVYASWMGGDQLEQVLLAQSVPAKLVVNDRIDGDRRARQPPDQFLLPRREGAETFGPDFDEGVGPDSLDESRFRRGIGGEKREGGKERKERDEEAFHDGGR